MNNIERIKEIYKKENNDVINENSIDGVSITAFYMFYHYYNADITRLDELNNNFCYLTGEDGEVIAINNNYYEDNVIDFLFTSVVKDDNNLDLNINKFLELITNEIANIVCGNSNETNTQVIEKLGEFDRNDDTIFNAVLICNYSIPINKKIEYQNLFAGKTVKNGRVKFNIIFEDDLVEELTDVESPRDCVASGKLELYNDNVSYFGDEKSFIAFISANSLKKLYFLYSTHGLFAANLRYYVKSTKIDSQIVYSIQNEPDNFCYYNNGIIITCDDYIIKKNTVELFNFSIVNGGQTTNLIGRTNFDKDFSLMCKIIKNKYKDESDKIDFLSKVAEASNTQKPIKAKDLIANRKEQRDFKNKFERVGIFLQTKRGDKISKEKYSQPWQNATNDQVAQMIYSSVFQCPGASKNSKSKLLENEKIYDKIFKNEYNSNFFVAIQHLKVAYNNWVKQLKIIEKNNSILLGLAKNCDLIMLAVLSILYKYIVNDKLKERLGLIQERFLNYENEGLRESISQNDIGLLAFIDKNAIIGLIDDTYFMSFNDLFELFIIPSYELFKKDYPNNSYSHFVKSDYYYYNYIVPYTIKFIKRNNIPNSILNIFDITNKSNISIDYQDIFNNSRPGLEEELKEYRTNIYKKTNGKIPAYNVFNNNQLVYLVKYMPKNLKDLKIKGKLREKQIEDYGQAICKIINKYANPDDYR